MARTAPKVRPDKEKVIDEVWDEARIRSFLDKRPPVQSGVPLPGDADFFVLRHAYQAMRPEDFALFLGFFVEQGRDVKARNADGQTLAQAIAPHRHAAPFIELLDAH